MTHEAPPPLDVIGPDGRRLTVAIRRPAAPAISLRHALELDELLVAGRVIGDDEILVGVDDLRTGVRVDGSRQPPPTVGRAATAVARGSGSPLVEFAVVTGPDCSTWKSLAAGRYVVGRSRSAHLRIDDALLQPHLGVIDVDQVGVVRFTQLSGPREVRVGGRAIGGDGVVRRGESLQLGASSMIFRDPSEERAVDHGTVIDRHRHDPWRRVVRRVPSVEPDDDGPTFVEPRAPALERWPPATGLIGAVVGAFGAGLIATVLGSALFAIVGVVGAVGSVMTWLAAVAGVARKRRRMRRAHVSALERFDRSISDAATAHREAAARRDPPVMAVLGGPAVDGAVDRPVDRRTWSRRAADGRLRFVAGRGTERWVPEVRDADGRAAMSDRVQRLEGVAGPVTLSAGDIVAVRGARPVTLALGRSAVAQLATWWGPVDWRLIVISRDPEAWAWTTWLPHDEPGHVLATDDPELADQLDDVGTDDERLTILVTDEPAVFVSRTGPIRRFVARTRAATIVMVGPDDVVPALCHRILTIGATGRCRCDGDVLDRDVVDLDVAGISASTAHEVAARLAPLTDPELGGRRVSLPPLVRLSELTGDAGDAEGVIARWQAGGAELAPVAPIGRSSEGEIEIDLVRDGPHALVAGTTGSGKSELLRTLVVALATRLPPTAVNFVLLDYKGGSTFDACADLPHTVGLVTDLDDGLAARALASLDAEIRRREALLRDVGAAGLDEYRRLGRVAPLARLVLVIDEFAALARELPDFLSSLVSIAQRGRSLGVHLVLATQRPTGVVSDDIRSNTDLRIALRLQDRSDAIDIVGDSGPVALPRSRPGAAVLRLGPDELIEFQSATCSLAASDTTADVEISVPDAARVGRESGGAGREGNDDPDPDVLSELRQRCAAIGRAAQLIGLARPHRPWLDPLPAELPAAAVTEQFDERAVGLADDPAHQCRRAVRWRPGGGNLALVGPVGSGVTTTLIAVAARTLSASDPDRQHVYVIDARGDDRWRAFDRLAHVGGVVLATEPERFQRLMRRLLEAIDDRIDDPERIGHPYITLFVDGLTTAVGIADAIDLGETGDLIRRVLADGPAVGVETVFGDDAPSRHPAADRWRFDGDDPATTSTPGAHRSTPRPGRIRIESSGLEAQIAIGAPGLAAIPDRVDRPGGPAPLRVLPTSVAVGELVVGGGDQLRIRDGDGTRSVVIGLGAHDLAVAAFDIGRGDHVIVLGESGTGVSTATRRCAAGLVAATGATLVDGSADQPMPDDRMVGPEPIVCVIDDAHLDHDPNGLVERVLSGRLPHVTIVAGGRLGAVRSAYGHWTRQVAQLRCGLVMVGELDVDGDVFGVALPRRPLVAPRPGLAWVIDRNRPRLVQIARDRAS